jgi:hypothetical protein
MKSLLVLSIIVCVGFVTTASDTRGQAPEAGAKLPSAEQYRTELAKSIAAYPNGAELFRESDNFQRFIRRQIAIRLGMTKNESRSTAARPEKDRDMIESASSKVSDISPDTSDETEASIAISRANPKIIVAGANDIWAQYDSSMPAFVSTDGGVSWQTHWLPLVVKAQCQAYGDPAITCDDKGMFYYAFLMSSQSNVLPGYPYLSDVVVAHSSNGVSWTLGAPVAGNTIPSTSQEDKETIAVDRDASSQYYGRVYVAWRHISGQGFWDKYQIAHSDDHGMTWSKPVSRLTRYGYFEQLRIGKGGTIFVGTSFRDLNADTGTHGMQVSHDGGKTFHEHFIASYTNYPRNIYYPNALKGSFKAYPYLSFDVDPVTNYLYAVYGNYESGGYAAQYAVTSTDEGTTWSDPLPIGTPDLLASDHFQPWVSFDPAAGKAFVAMYSSEEDLVVNAQARMVRFNFDALTTPESLGSSLFDPSMVLNPWDPFPAFIGDYIGGDACAGTYVTAWTQHDRFGTGGDIFAYVSSASGSVNIGTLKSHALEVSEPTPNPCTGNTVLLTVSSDEGGTATVRLFDICGREVLSQIADINSSELHTITLDVHQIPAGVYRAVITTANQSEEKNIVVLR